MLELNSISSILFQKNIDKTLEHFATRPNIYFVLLSPTAPRARQFPSQYWRASIGGEYVESVDPGTEEPITAVADGTAADIDRAVTVATDAFAT